MIAVIAALPREVASLVRGASPDLKLKRNGIYLYRLPSALVVCAGMGAQRVTLAVRTAFEADSLTRIVSAGLAGGCDPAKQVGALVEASVVIDSLSGERFGHLGGTEPLVTTHTIASISEKRRLFASYGAVAVDMEAATVARLAHLRGVPFQAIKAISDAHDFELSSLSRFASQHGHFRTGAFALHTALRPASWRKTMKLGTGSQLALRTLNDRLKEIVA